MDSSKYLNVSQNSSFGPCFDSELFREQILAADFYIFFYIFLTYE